MQSKKWIGRGWFVLAVGVLALIIGAGSKGAGTSTGWLAPVGLGLIIGGGAAWARGLYLKGAGK